MASQAPASCTRGRRRTLWLAIAVLVLAGVLRFANIGWSYSNNGIDEGIMAERAMLVRDGYALYSDIPCDQAPFAFYLGAALGGDLLLLRILVAALSLAAVAACMFASKAIGGDRAMLITGLLLAADFAFVRESRLFSLDALSSIFLAFSMAVMVRYLKDRSLGTLVVAGLLIGFSAATKLLGALGILGMLAFLVLETRAGRRPRREGMVAAAVLVVTAAIPLLMYTIVLGPKEVYEGMVVGQSGRSADLYLKLSLVAYFGVNPAYVLPVLHARALWRADERNRFLICVAAVVLVFMIVQPLLFFHHLVLLSPAMAILAGVAADRLLPREGRAEGGHQRELRRFEVPDHRVVLAVLLAPLLVSYGLCAYGTVAQREPIQVKYARWLEEVTDPDEFVISGDPGIPAMAGRLVPPELVNVAYRQSGEVTLEDIETAIVDYAPPVVIVCYRLNEVEGLEELLLEKGYSQIHMQIVGSDRAVLDLFEKGIGPVGIWIHVGTEGA